ncbi:Beta-Galactosidase-1-Like Protein 3 [Manis pentadactyla]|nr:Beta-Galactosidase-1-Like Protein 3 [Manis pentadactyla]
MTRALGRRFPGFQSPGSCLRPSQPVISSTPVHTENLPISNGDGQSCGLVLYETSICSGGRLRADAQDTAQVFLNETSIGILGDNTPDLSIPKIKVLLITVGPSSKC